jgi:hypothetical protein
MQPPWQAHRNPKRELMSRSDVDKTRPSYAAIVQDHAVVVYRRRNYLGAESLKHARRTDIPGILHAKPITRIEK